MVARSSASATISALERTRSLHRGSPRAAAENAAGIRHSVASASATPPTIVSAGSSSASASAPAINATPIRPSRAIRALLDDLAARGGGPERGVGGAPGAQVQQRRHRGERGREHPAADRERDRAAMDGLLGADRKGRREEARDLLEERPRQQVSQRHAHQRGDDPKHHRLGAEQQQDLAGVVALHSQLGDEAPPLGHRPGGSR